MTDHLGLLSASVGLLTSVTGSMFTSTVMSLVKLREDYEPPVGPGEEVRWKLWKIATGQHHVPMSGIALGWMESALFFVGVLFQSETIVGGWLAFKLAAKWESWTNIIAVELKGVPFDDDD